MPCSTNTRQRDNLDRETQCVAPGGRHGIRRFGLPFVRPTFGPPSRAAPGRATIWAREAIIVPPAAILQSAAHAAPHAARLVGTAAVGTAAVGRWVR